MNEKYKNNRYLTEYNLGSKGEINTCSLKDVAITSNDPNNRSVHLPVYGKSIAPEITASPDFLDFGEVSVGSEANKQFAIANQGDAPLTGTITAPAGFTINSVSKYVKRSDNSLLYNIPVGESVIFDITFSPSLDQVHSDNNLELAPSSDTHLPEKKHRKKHWKKRKSYIYW